MTPEEREWFLDQSELTWYTKRLNEVPQVCWSMKLGDRNIKDMDSLIAFADGKSINAKHREGLVFKDMDSNFSFKVISNKYLLKEK